MEGTCEIRHYVRPWKFRGWARFGDNTDNNYVRVQMSFNSLITEFFKGSEIEGLIQLRPWQIAYMCTWRIWNHKFHKLPYLITFTQVRSRTYRSSRLEGPCKKGVLRIFAKFTGKHLYQGIFFNKVAGLQFY